MGKHPTLAEGVLRRLKHWTWLALGVCFPRRTDGLDYSSLETRWLSRGLWQARLRVAHLM
jgi:hypothetical protein